MGRCSSRRPTRDDEPYYPVNRPQDRERLLEYREMMKGEQKPG